MRIRDIMHFEVIMLNPEDTARKALEVMNEKKINGAPVVDKDRKLQGIIVKADVYRFLIEEGHYDTYPISNIMTKEVVTADIDEDIIDVAQKIIDNEIVAIPVLEEEKVIGLVSIENLIQHFIDIYKEKKADN
ncbi:CBS domain-containing protein [Clostridium bovifaecis]|uniref:CBS domain-containing protein n=1 Tax=Clostridium bovifaecis TaxID=2184719 RepID=A0A6I6EQ42_9CLOT|nr:CBS domain-containing protein [Clostridium bovifaecis]